jgi:large subunit ribosomal protein L25
MKLSVFQRTTSKKSDSKKLRREGNVPAVLYGAAQENRNVYIKREEMQAILRGMKPGLLPTTVFELHEGNHEHKAVVKEIQYQPATYEILHVDFALLSASVPVTLNVPIQIAGAADCVGVRLGGFLRQVIRSLKVSCLPKDIPEMFLIDVRDMNIAQSKRLSEIALPAGIRPLAKMDEVAVVIAKKAT